MIRKVPIHTVRAKARPEGYEAELRACATSTETDAKGVEWLTLDTDSAAYKQLAGKYARYAHPKPEAPPAYGPGTELHLILQRLGFTVTGCGGTCQFWIDKMNRWGVEGCKAHRAEIVSYLDTQKEKAAMLDKLKAGAIALAEGIPKSVGGLVDEAIRRAAEHGTSCKSPSP